MTKLERPETTGADISTPDKSEALISLLDEYIDLSEEDSLIKQSKIEQLEEDYKHLEEKVEFDRVFIYNQSLDRVKLCIKIEQLEKKNPLTIIKEAIEERQKIHDYGYTDDDWKEWDRNENQLSHLKYTLKFLEQ